MRYIESFLFLSFASCTACYGCSGLLRFGYGIITENREWGTANGWTVGMLSACAIGIAIVIVINHLTMIRHDVDNINREDPED